MSEQIAFIGREEEVKLINKLIEAQGSRYIIAINAEGGIGKSRLMREIYNELATKKDKNYIITEIIDFDDLAFHIPENVTRKIASMLDPKSFVTYSQAETDYRKIQGIGVSSERLEEEKQRVNQKFWNCFNSISVQKRIILFFDTTDKLEKGKGVWSDIEMKLPGLKNAVVLIAGRNAYILCNSLQPTVGKDQVKIIHLEALSKDDSKEYIEAKQRQKHIIIESDLIDKLFLLTGGKPILIDLAVEWRARGISLEWLEESKLKDLKKLTHKQMIKRQKEFEKQLVNHIKNIRSPLDQLILLMAHVYPLNAEMVKSFLNKVNGQAFFEEAKEYVFVKPLPNDYITLHDVMRDMINDYVWKEADPEQDRRRWYSQQVLEYYKGRIKELTEQINKGKLSLKNNQESEPLEISLRREESNQQIWVLREQLLFHTLFTNIAEGVKTFVELFDEATKETRLFRRRRFVNMLGNYRERLSPEQLCILDIHTAQQFFTDGEYEESRDLCIELLGKGNLSTEQKIETNILKGNSEIRLGDVGKSIKDFEKAVTISKDNNLKLQEIQAMNALGWAHRLTGDLEQAINYYREARNLCLKEGAPIREEFAEDYGLVMNNYAYALSSENKTRKAAIDLAQTAIEHWRKIGNDIGLGAGYLVLGIAYYQSDHAPLALQTFQKSLSIFEPLRLNDWLGQIYSWRGAQYHDIQDYEKAKADFELSLRIGTPYIDAMTLNRLARVYMRDNNWDLAEETMTKALNRAKEIPDYVYWLGSIARLISISAKKYLNDRRRIANEFDKYKNEVETFEGKFKNPDKNSKGMAYLGLAKLAFLLNDIGMKDSIIKYLQEGVPLVVEYGSFARSDILTRLNIIEEDFNKTDTKIIHAVGEEMQDFVIQKETDNINYGTVVERMFKWANW